LRTSTATTRTAPTPTRTTPIRTPTARTRSALALCVEPVEPDRFLEEYWERRPLLVPRGEEGRFDDLFSLDEAERLVSSTGLRYPAIRVVKEGEKIPVGAYTETVSWRPTGFTGTANVERVAEEFERGATIVVQALHLHHLPLAEFCRTLEGELGHPVQTNAYYTPRSAQGLPVHHDTHDVLCLQVSGEKRWLVYPPALELPLKDQRYSEDVLGPHGEPVLDVTLQPGDTLYLPRGWLHEALTSESDSLHLTVGVNVYTWLDAVRSALEEAAREEVSLRRAVGDEPEELLELVRAKLDRESVARRRRARFISSRRPIREDRFEQLRALRRLDAHTLLERRPTVLFDIEPGEDSIVLAFEGRRVVFPGHAREEVEAAAAADEPFSGAELPGALDEAGKVVLVSRLVREGFLRVSPDAW
jgi:bifunctional lysine-specific demethylase and histidyl-hydroxylase NO66